MCAAERTGWRRCARRFFCFCPPAYVIPEAERRLREALLHDERILSVEDFAFKRQGGRLAISFVVKSIYGELELKTEAAI